MEAEGETSNHLFQTLEEWNLILRGASVDLRLGYKKTLAICTALPYTSKQMIIRSVRHRGLKRLIEDNQIKGLGSDLVNRIRNIITTLILADDMAAFRNSAPQDGGFINFRETAKIPGVFQHPVTGGSPL